MLAILLNKAITAMESVQGKMLSTEAIRRFELFRLDINRAIQYHANSGKVDFHKAFKEFWERYSKINPKFFADFNPKKVDVNNFVPRFNDLHYLGNFIDSLDRVPLRASRPKRSTRVRTD